MINSITNKLVILICVKTISFFSALTIHAYEYSNRTINDYEINENTSLSKEEMDELINDENNSEIPEPIESNSLEPNCDIKEDFNEFTDFIKDLNEESLEESNTHSLKSSLFGINPNNKPLNTINTSPSSLVGFEGFFV